MNTIKVVYNPSVVEIVRLFDEIRNSGCIFSAQFIKKDGTLRRMNCRTKVTKYLKGGKKGYIPIQKGLITVFDLKKKEYRSVNLNTIQKVSFGHTTYVFNDHQRSDDYDIGSLWPKDPHLRSVEDYDHHQW